MEGVGTLKLLSLESKVKAEEDSPYVKQEGAGIFPWPPQKPNQDEPSQARSYLHRDLSIQRLFPGIQLSGKEIKVPIN